MKKLILLLAIAAIFVGCEKKETELTQTKSIYEKLNGNTYEWTWDKSDTIQQTMYFHNLDKITVHNVYSGIIVDTTELSYNVDSDSIILYDDSWQSVSYFEYFNDSIVFNKKTTYIKK